MNYFHDTSKPYVRWWWIRGPYREADIVFQLDWVKANGFGGVELAWIYPLWIELESAQNPDFLGEEWTRLTAFTKSYADKIGLGCDFTFGSCWPFGGMCVAPEDAVQTFDGPSSQRLIGAWDEEIAGRGRIVNHLSRTALSALRRRAGAGLPSGHPGRLLGVVLRFAGGRYRRHVESGTVVPVREPLWLLPATPPAAGQ